MATSREKLAAARAAKKKAQAEFGSWPQVGSFGITRTGTQYAVKISLQSPLPPSRRFPAEIDSIPVIVQLTGPIRKSKP